MGGWLVGVGGDPHVGAPYLVLEGARDGFLLVLVCSLCFWLKVEISNSFNSDGHRVGFVSGSFRCQVWRISCISSPL